MEDIFKEKPSTIKAKGVVNLALYGVSYIEALERVGLRRGNKVRNQASIPGWILNNKKYARACLRGLVDTDGGVYTHRHIVSGKKYVNFGLSSCNHSKPIIAGSMDILSSNGIRAYVAYGKKIYVYSFDQVGKNFNIVGSSNPKHLTRLSSYIKSRNL